MQRPPALFKVSVEGDSLSVLCLPFGLAPAPRVFTKILKPVMAALRSRGVRVIIYLDDMLFLNEEREGLVADVKMASDLLQRLGFFINWEKSLPTPSQSLEFLGKIVNSFSLAFILPKTKREKTRKLCVQALTKNRIKLRDLAKVMGNFSWAIPVVPFTQAHYRKVQSDLIWMLGKNGGNFEKYLSLSEEARADLSWWVRSMDSSKGKVIFQGEPDMIIFLDASLSGWGAVSNEATARGPWSAKDVSRHINELELLAAFFVCSNRLLRRQPTIVVSLQMDHSTAVCYVNNGGGSRLKSLSLLAGLL